MKIKLTFWQIVNMNIGFLGLQYSFGLQQANMSPIYSYLGAQESKLPFLWLAGPLTGLIVQPIVGSLSDKTNSKWGRRTPYFLIGAIFCSVSLFIMPFSRTVLMAASILWILDAANNVTQEPYRAFVSDKLDKEQHALGFLTQSAFTGLGQTLAYITPSLLLYLGINKMAETANHIPLTTLIAFMIGGVLSISSILYSILTTKETPFEFNSSVSIYNLKALFVDIYQSMFDLPKVMKQMIPMMFFSWYAMFIYWIYIAKCLEKSIFKSTGSLNINFRNADLLAGQAGAFYNFIAFVSAFGIALLSKKYGAKLMHLICLAISGMALIVLPQIHDPKMIFIPMIGLGLSWASMMGNPYVLLAGSVPPDKVGIYMGVFNMFIVIPMLLQNLTMPLYYSAWLNNDPTHAIMLAGLLLILAALSMIFIREKNTLKQA